MKHLVVVVAAAAAFAAPQAGAETGGLNGWSSEVATVFLDTGGDTPELRDRSAVEEGWAALEEGQQAQVRADCAAALEVGAAVEPAGSATGDVGADPEVEAVEPDARNEMESAEAAGAGTEALPATGPQREVLLDAVDADTWVALCEMVADL